MTIYAAGFDILGSGIFAPDLPRRLPPQKTLDICRKSCILFGKNVCPEFVHFYKIQAIASICYIFLNIFPATRITRKTKAFARKNAIFSPYKMHNFDHCGRFTVMAR